MHANGRHSPSDDSYCDDFNSGPEGSEPYSPVKESPFPVYCEDGSFSFCRPLCREALGEI